jgi:cytochrome c2
MQNARAVVAILAAVAAVALMMAGALVMAPRAALANQAIAQKTGKPCTACHTAAPALNAYGKKYKDSLKK